MTLLSTISIPRALGAAVVFFLSRTVITKAISIYSTVRAFNKSVTPYAGILWLHPFRSVALVSGPWFPSRSHIGSFYKTFAPYKNRGSTAVASVLFRNSIPTIWLADPQGIQTVAGEAVLFQKDIDAYGALNFYGQNLIGVEGSDWRRHRKVAKSAFNETGNAFVWAETIRAVNEWFAHLDAAQVHEKQPIIVDAAKDLLQLALIVISSAGFGRRASWTQNASTVAPPGHLMAFGPAVFAAVDHLHTKVLTPGWLYTLSERFDIPVVGRVVRDTVYAYEALQRHIMELVSLSRAWVVEGKVASMDAGLLRNLVEANMALQDDEDAPKGSPNAFKSLTEDELLSNSFAFLLAGHETTAHSLSFAVGFLALHPEAQRKIYEEALLLWPDGTPTSASTSSYKECMPKLPYTTAVFHETIRLFPAVVRLSKLVHADATIPAQRFTTNASGKVDLDSIRDTTVHVKTGSMVMLDIFALHQNPICWGPDATEFKPERFIDTESYRWPRDAFVAFSAGPRNCIGQRFALTESVCFLASLVRTYEISVPATLRGKSFEEQKRVMLDWTPGVTMVPNNCVVSLTRR
ncbi:cytochrome P450 [Favolaschia claudopus]|uniref:Cytochrome P450 n=1 Tax=Favolaschia claudopus TaxID=2862362 RepID=A0AAW0D0E0_9AGAR